MSAPTNATNLDLIGKCIEDVLKNINNANGYRTDGFVVSRGHDPRTIRDNLPEEYNSKLAAIGYHVLTQVEDPTKSLGGFVSWDCTYQLLILRTLGTDEDQAGITLDTIEANTKDDIWPPIARDRGLAAASTRLGIAQPYIIGHKIVSFSGGGPQWFPDTRIIATGKFTFRERI